MMDHESSQFPPDDEEINVDKARQEIAQEIDEYVSDMTIKKRWRDVIRIAGEKWPNWWRDYRVNIPGAPDDPKQVGLEYEVMQLEDRKRHDPIWYLCPDGINERPWGFPDVEDQDAHMERNFVILTYLHDYYFREVRIATKSIWDDELFETIGRCLNLTAWINPDFFKSAFNQVRKYVERHLGVNSDHADVELSGDAHKVSSVDQVIKETEILPFDSRVAKHSPTFNSVFWHGKTYSFTSMQAACVKILWEAWEKRTPDVNQAYLLEQADSLTNRLRDIFKKNGTLHPAWQTMIVAGPMRGTFRLTVPQEKH